MPKKRISLFLLFGLVIRPTVVVVCELGVCFSDKSSLRSSDASNWKILRPWLKHCALDAESCVHNNAGLIQSFYRAYLIDQF